MRTITSFFKLLFFVALVNILFLKVVFGTAYPERNLIKVKLQEDHNWMMWASIGALSEFDIQYLEPEVELLIVNYTNFPDRNWGNYGEWGGWTGYPNSQRTPNLRREWGISKACMYNPVSKKGIPLSLHGGRQKYDQTIEALFTHIIELFKKGKHGDAVRVIGVISHGIQDAATFPDFPAVHRSSTFKWVDGIGIENYTPVILGETTNEAISNINKKIQQLIKFADRRVMDIRCAMKNNDWEEDKQMRIKCANEASKIVADLIHTSIYLAGPKISETNSFNTNLIINGDIEESDNGEPSPLGWVSHWNDLNDKIGVFDWEGRVPRNQNLRKSGSRSLKMMWAPEEGLEWRQTWDAAHTVAPGEFYIASAWAKTVDATGKNILALEFYSANADLIISEESVSITGTAEWSQIKLHARVPNDAFRMRVVLKSISNEGAIWFDDIELMQLESDVPGNKFVDAKPDPLMFQLTFNEGMGVRTLDSSIFKNGPNNLYSGYSLYDLYTQDGFIGAGLEFDGIDDFVECPALHDIDVQCPKEAMTLSMYLCIYDYRDAVIVCKEQYPLDEQVKGYRLELIKSGKLRFTIHTDLGKVSCESAGRIPLNRWINLMAVRKKEKIILYVDKEKGEESFVPGLFRPAFFSKSSDAPSHLYLGSDTGCKDFFSGKIDEFKIYSN